MNSKLHLNYLDSYLFSTISPSVSSRYPSLPSLFSLYPSLPSLLCPQVLVSAAVEQDEEVRGDTIVSSASSEALRSVQDLNKRAFHMLCVKVNHQSVLKGL